jgi:cardiolipin synthase
MMKRLWSRSFSCAVSVLHLELFIHQSHAESLALDEALTLEEKLLSFDIPKVQVTYPTVIMTANAWRERLIELIRGSRRII